MRKNGNVQTHLHLSTLVSSHHLSCGELACIFSLKYIIVPSVWEFISLQIAFTEFETQWDLLVIQALAVISLGLDFSKFYTKSFIEKLELSLMSWYFEEKL